MIRFLFFFLAFAGAAHAKCDMSSLDFEQMREAHNSFLSDKNKEAAKDFFASIPDKFCQFNGAYGFDDVFGAQPDIALSYIRRFPCCPNTLHPVYSRRNISSWHRKPNGTLTA